MNSLVPHDGKPVTMTSLEIVGFINDDRKAQAEAAGAEFPSKGYAKLDHSDFMKKVLEVLGERAGNFSATYQIPGPNGSRRSAPSYRFPKREASLMAMSYSYAMQARVWDHMTALEDQAQQAAPAPAALTRMQILEIAMESEKARIEAEVQRDEAVRTKALIGSKREASAMAKASAAVREVKRLTEELGRNAKHATITAVENALGRRLGKQDWVPLRRYCKSKGLQAEKVHDPRWGEATAWPAEAWSAVHGIDLNAIFPEPQVGMH